MAALAEGVAASLLEASWTLLARATRLSLRLTFSMAVLEGSELSRSFSREARSDPAASFS